MTANKFIKRTLKTVGTIVLCAVLFVVLLVVALYVHPVQKFLADKAADYVSEEMNMEVKVGDINLKFPLELHLYNVSAVGEDKDTMLSLSDFCADIRLKPLFSKVLYADSLILHGTGANTKDLISAIGIKGSVDNLTVYDTEWDFNKASMNIDSIRIDRASLGLELRNDTTKDEEESESPLKTISVRSLCMNTIDIGIDLDTTQVNVGFSKFCMGADIDLETPSYRVHNLNVNNMSCNYSSAGMGISITDLDVGIKSGEMVGNEIQVNNLTADINESGNISLSSAYYNLENGKMSADGHADISDVKTLISGVVDMEAVKTVNDMISALPDESSLTADFSLNEDSVQVGNAIAVLPGTASVTLSDVKFDIKSGNLIGDVVAHVDNEKGLKKLLPKEIRGLFYIPQGTTLSSRFEMTDGKLNLDNTFLTTSGGATMKVGRLNYDVNTEEYDIDIDVRNFIVNQFVPLPERTELTGHIVAKGKGFDFFAPSTYTNARLNVKSARYGQYALANTEANVALKKSNLNAEMTMRDDNLYGDMTYNGSMKKSGINGHMTLDVPKADLYALKLMETPFCISTSGIMNVNTDFRNNLQVDAGILGLLVDAGEETVMVDEFELYANSSKTNTELSAISGDMDINLYSPMGYENLIDKFVKTGNVVAKQLQELKLNVDEWKELLPEMSLSAQLGQKNPVTQVMNINGIVYDDVRMDVRTSSEIGLRCNANVLGFQTEGVKLDTIALNIFDDSTHIGFTSSVTFPEQNDIRPFTAAVNGFLAPNKSEVNLLYWDEHGDKGIDLGLRAQAVDSMLCMDVYPFDPIIGYKHFAVSDSNYINLHKKNRVFADVDLVSLDDSCRVHLLADPADDERQMIRALVQNLNMEPLVAMLPFAPEMKGMLNGDLAFIQKMDTTFSVAGNVGIENFIYESTEMGKIDADFTYNPTSEGAHHVEATLRRNDIDIATVNGVYHDGLNATLHLADLPLDILSAFMKDVPVTLNGCIGGNLSVTGPMDKLNFNGILNPKEVHAISKVYSIDFSIDNDTVYIADSRLDFDQLRIYSKGQNPITVRGNVDFADLTDIQMNVSVTGRNVEIINAPKTRQSEIFGKVYGNIVVRVRGSVNDMQVTGNVTILNTSDITYMMTNTALSMGYRLDDIVTFADFTQAPDSAEIPVKTYSGLDMRINLTVEDGARIMCIFSADGKSYVDIQGGGTLTLVNQKEGVTQLLGRYTINSGQMKYSNSVIPLKTFSIEKGSYIEFTGEPMNPALNIAATERERASVSNSDGSTRMVTFNTGLRISQTLNNLGLEFTIDAPEDLYVQNELASLTAEEKNKLAVSMLATGMYLSSTNSSSFSTTNALNNFLQGEINNLAGKAINSVLKVDMNVGMEQTMDNSGESHTDYSFKFSKRLFSDRLNVVVGGMINTKGNPTSNHSGTYIDNVSMEWRLDKGGTQYIRLFHDRDYNNLLEGEITENGGGVVLRRKLDQWKDLWKLFDFRKETPLIQQARIPSQYQPNATKHQSGNASQEKK